MTEQPRLIVLMTKATAVRKQLADQSRSISMLESKNLPFDIIDCSDPAMKEKRNELFKISGVRGNYPQFFFGVVDDASKPPTFVGDFDTIESINDCSSLSEDVLESNPKIMTWDRLYNGGAVGA